jgi:hypothetical protein
MREWICGDCAEKLPESLEPFAELLPDCRFLSFSVLNLFPATVCAMSLRWIVSIFLLEFSLQSPEI